MSKSERDRFEREEKWWRVFRRDRGVCQHCGRPAAEGKPQLAHVIAKTGPMRKRYGDAIIDHDRNVVLTCSLRCNGAVQITNNPVECGELVERIMMEVDREGA